jgi:hypothetical protein
MYKGKFFTPSLGSHVIGKFTVKKTLCKYQKLDYRNIRDYYGKNTTLVPTLLRSIPAFDLHPLK